MAAGNAFEIVGQIVMNGGQQVQQQLNQLSQKVAATGQAMQAFGTGLSAWVTAPLAAVGVGAAKVANDMQVAQGSMQAQLGLTAKEAQGLNATAQDLWEQGFGTDMQDVTNKVAAVTRSLGTLNQQDLKAVTGGMDMLQQQFGTEPQENLNAMKSLMQNFGMSATEAMDYLTAGYQQNLDYSGEFTDTIREYGTYFSEMGFKGNEFFAVLKSGAEGGAFQLDKVGDSMKEFTLRSKDGSDASKEAFTALGLNANQMTAAFNKGGEAGRLAFTQVVSALQNTKNETERNKIATALFGTQYEDLGEEAFNAMLKAGQGMSNVEGATARAGAAMRDNFGTRLQSAWRQLQTALLPVGMTLLDMADKILPPLTAAIQKVAAGFEAMSPVGQTVVTVIGLIAAAIGPVITIIGTLVGAVAPLIPHLSKLKGGFTLVRTALMALTGPIGATVAIITGLVIAGKELYENWDTIKNHPLVKGTVFGALMTGMEKVKGLFSSAIPPVDNFGNTVSKATQKSVTELTNLANKGTQQLNYLSSSGTQISQQMATKLTGIYNDMSTKIVAALQKQKEQGIQSQTEFFNQSAALSTQREAEIVANTQKSYDDRILKTQEGNARINEIIQTAANEHRSITTAERDEINRIKNEMVETGIQAMSKNELETKTILERMKQNSGAMNAQMAADTVQQSIKARDGAIKSANETYDQKIAKIIQMRDESGSITAQEADKLIQEATRQKDQSIQKAKEMHSGVVSEAKLQAGEHVNEVNWTTGEVKTKWQTMKDDTIQKAKEMGSNIKKSWNDWVANNKRKNEEARADSAAKWNRIRNDVSDKASDLASKAKNKFEELRKNASTKFNNILSSARSTWNNIKTAITNPVESARSKVSSITNKIKGYFDKLKNLKIGISRNISTPTFKVDNWSWNPADWLKKWPKIRVVWNAMGGFFNSPTVMQGLGEDGRELVLPLSGSRKMRPYAEMLARSLADMDLGSVTGGAASFRIEVPVYLNGKEIARAMAPDMDRALQKEQQKTNTFRGVTL